MNYKIEDVKNLGVVVLMALVVIGVVAGIGISNTDQEPKQEPEQEVIVQVEEDYLPESFKQSYLTGCLEGDLNQYNFCVCSFDYLDRNFTNREVLDMSYEMELTGEFTDEMFDAVASCIDSYIY